MRLGGAARRLRQDACAMERAFRMRYDRVNQRSCGPHNASSGGSVMAAARTRVKIAPKGMGLNDFVAMQEGFFAADGLDVEFDWKTFRGTQSSWKDLQYFQRPQDL